MWLSGEVYHDLYKPCVHVPGRLVLPVMQLLEEGQGESPLSKHLVSPAGSLHSSWHHPLLQKHFHHCMFLEAQPLLWLLLHCRKEGEKMQTTRICAFFVLLPTALTYSIATVNIARSVIRQVECPWCPLMWVISANLNPLPSNILVIFVS